MHLCTIVSFLQLDVCGERGLGTVSNVVVRVSQVDQAGGVSARNPIDRKSNQ